MDYEAIDKHMSTRPCRIVARLKTTKFYLAMNRTAADRLDRAGVWPTDQAGHIAQYEQESKAWAKDRKSVV